MTLPLQSTMSEYGSEESTNGEQDPETSPQKSPAPGEKSPGQSSSSSAHADDEGDSPCSSSGGGGSGRGSAPRHESTSTAGGEGGVGSASVTGVTERPAASCTPQQFSRVTKDKKSTCARTDLVYVHPPAAEKVLATSTTKVRPQGLHLRGQAPGYGTFSQLASKLGKQVHMLTQHFLFVCRFRCLVTDRVLMEEEEGLVDTYWNISRAFLGTWRSQSSPPMPRNCQWAPRP